MTTDGADETRVTQSGCATEAVSEPSDMSSAD